jgi:hypothetical protein
MASRETIARRQVSALETICDVVAKHDPGAVEQLQHLTPGGTIPHTVKQPDAFAVYLVESLAVLARKVDELADATPKRRGRKPKAKQAS